MIMCMGCCASKQAEVDPVHSEFMTQILLVWPAPSSMPIVKPDNLESCNTGLSLLALYAMATALVAAVFDIERFWKAYGMLLLPVPIWNRLVEFVAVVISGFVPPSP